GLGWDGRRRGDRRSGHRGAAATATHDGKSRGNQATERERPRFKAHDPPPGPGGARSLHSLDAGRRVESGNELQGTDETIRSGSPHMPLTAGHRVGPYEVVSPVGAGGMGEVYRARDTRLGRDVALKVLPADHSGNPDRLRRFEQEARAVAALNHP